MNRERIKFKNLFSLRPKAAASLILVLFLGIFVAGNFVFAGPVDDFFATVLSHVVGALVHLLGLILTMIMSLLIKVAGYNDFINSGAVTTGWAIVRDICNMFFIVILLVISFATILRIEGYDIKRMVPKLIIMAVLINFSKTICGLILDAANLVMGTFVNAFGNTGDLSMVQMMGLNDLLTFVKDQDNAGVTGANVWPVFGAYVFAFIYMIIAIVVVVVLLAVLVVRIVMLWIYIVLSPLAYLLATFPQGKKYVSQWWDEFIKYAITGPILAFFLWLSFVSLGNGQSGSAILGMSTAVKDPSGLTQAMTTDNLMKFIISIGMLLGGLIITQQAGGQMGKLAGAGMAKIQGGGKWLSGKAKTGAKEFATGAVGGTAMKAAGIALTRTSLARVDSLKKVGAVATAMGTGLQKNVADEQKKRRIATLKNIGLGGEEGQQAVQDLAKSRLGRTVKTGARVAGGVTAAMATGGLGGIPGVVGVTAGLVYGVGHGLAAGISGRGRKQAEERKKIDESFEKKHVDPLKETRNLTVSAAAATRDEDLNDIKVKEDAAKKIGPLSSAQKLSFDQDRKTVGDMYQAAELRADKDFYSGVKNAAAAEEKDNTKFKTDKSKHVIDADLKLKNYEIDADLVDGKIDADIAAKRRLDVSKENKTREEEYKYGVGPQKWLKDYHPNKVTIEATKSGLKDVELAKQRVENLSNGSQVSKFSKGTFYSDSGQTDGQKRFFKELVNNSDKSVKAINEMVIDLNRLLTKQNAGETMEEGDKNKIEGLKQGIAAFKKGGNNIAPLNEVVNIVNQIETGKDGNKTVEDFESTVIENK